MLNKFKIHLRKRRRRDLKEGDKDWQTECMVCGQRPTVHPTGLCGVCCFGEASCAGGNW